ncbi:efflux RND transporter periplasmic adaptor subunit [Pseudomonas abieticivorans]|uniref:efflux RND transporter periplasmic adaptor subunit n=1 Tax=Pseudomonas abieticivorans TaxID=2931382 RepID=UPI0020C0B706|nr:efflux RND transporter periplasmic adaptor subunit [Pseudomonas sp. PIA16]
MRNPTKKILVLIIIVLLAVGIWLWKFPAAKKIAAPLAVPVKVATVVRQDVPRTLTGIGSVLSLHSVAVRPQVDGVLTKLWVKEGQQVKEGDLLASIDDRSIRASLDQARATLSQSQAQLQVAAVNLKRYKDLSVDNGISRQTLDQQQALVDQLKATVQGNQASIASAQVQLSYTQIRSPVTGRVGIRNVDEGNFLRVTDTQGLFSVTQIDPISIEFSLPQQALPTLQALVHGNQAAPVFAYVDGNAEDGTLLGQGQLSLIDNQISATTGTLRVKAVFDNGGQKLWPGQLVNIKVQTALQHDALVVPPTVVQRGLDGYYLYRLKGDKVESVPVKMLFQNSDLNVIEGVSDGDVVIRDGQSRLKPGSQVEILKDTPAEPLEVAQ